MNISEALTLTPSRRITCINTDKLKGNEHAPLLEKGKTYPTLEVHIDTDGNPHIEVGIRTDLNFITAYKEGVLVENREKLPAENNIHWCHPSRFELA
ncbi:MAG: hypothetical protein ACI88L_000575 [Candidatus Paceibacteria bacterium]|jgi:hypothetical protein